MYLLDQKAEDLLAKLTFAEQTIREIRSPDKILESYIGPLESWLGTLKGRVDQAKTVFAEFVQNAKFNQEGHLQDTVYRRLLAAILRDFEDIERRIYIGIDTFLPLIFVWNNQKNSQETKKHHGLLMHFVDDLLHLCNMPDLLMTIIGESYACLPIEWDHLRKHIIFGTYSEIQNLSKCVLLAHEIGHIHYYQNSLEINSKVHPEVRRKLGDKRPTNLDDYVFEQAIYIWTQHWIPEFVSDCFAAKTLGPAFVSQFMLAALNSQPDRIETTHPPSNLRVNFMLNILDDLDLDEVNVNYYKTMWESYAHTVSTPNSRFIVDEEAVRAVLNTVDSVVTLTPIEEKWADILEAKKTLSTGLIPDKDLISTLSALAIEENRVNGASLHKELLKRYSSNSNAS